MSDIFEALSKGRRDISEAILHSTPLPGPSPSSWKSSPDVPPPAEAAPERQEQPAGQPEPSLPTGLSLRAAAIRTVPLTLKMPEPLFPFDESSRESAEQYRIARTKIFQHPKAPRVLVVSSPAPRDGKTVTAINLAGALSLKSTTLLVDADLRRSTLAQSLGLPADPGLANVLDGRMELGDAIIRTQQYPNLYVIQAGKSRFNATELLESARWLSFVKECRAAFEYVVMDSPPIGTVADYELLAAAADGVIMVVHPDRTKRSLCYGALEKIPKGKLIGVLINGRREWILGPKPSQYYY